MSEQTYKIAAVLAALILPLAACGKRGADHVIASKDTTPKGPGLGKPIGVADLARINITVSPDGVDLPPGGGSVEQGAKVYATRCQSCHGPEGHDGQGTTPRLTGGIGSLASIKPLKTVNSYWPYAPVVFDYIRRAMPPVAPRTLSDDDVYAVTAYILSIDNLAPKDEPLDGARLRAVKMPNRDGFTSLQAMDGKISGGTLKTTSAG